MNRMEEYAAMMEQLESIPVSDPVGSAVRRCRRKQKMLRPLVAAAVVFLMFLTMINISPTAVAACKEVPLLRELVELLTFNPSLRVAVENDYVQYVEQEQHQNGVTAEIEYLIVDQKQVNIFYRLRSNQYEALNATPEILDENGEHLTAVVSAGGLGEKNEEIRKITVDFIDEDVPDTLHLTLKVQDVGSHLHEAPVAQIGDDLPQNEEPEYIAEFSFILHFDPQFTGQGRSIVLNKTAELDGQTITITDMEIYPTHIRINVMEEEGNSAWLTSLRFYLELENGFRVETISNGISATGCSDTPSMVSYRAESSYFYEADCIRLYITGADFLDKDREQVTIHLETLESDPLPQGVQLYKAEKKPSGWKVTFLTEPTELSHVQILSSTYHDLNGAEYHCGSWGSGSDYYFGSEIDSQPEMDYETYYLEGFHETVGIFKVNYTHFWSPEDPVVIELTGE